MNRRRFIAALAGAGWITPGVPANAIDAGFGDNSIRVLGAAMAV